MGLSQQITYNGFSFPFTTLSVSSAPIYAEDTVTVIATQYVFSVSGTIASIQGYQSPLSNESLNWQMSLMRSNLSQPGGNFEVAWGSGNYSSGTVNISSPVSTPFVMLPGFSGAPGLSEDGVPSKNLSSPATSRFAAGQDVQGGPHPGQLTFTHFSGGLAADYTWSLTTATKECWGPLCSLNDLSQSILALTIQYAFSVDPDGMVQRTITGKMIVTSAQVALGYGADSLRYQVTPPVPTNFKRVNQNFTQSVDGRELSFTITDQEVMYTLPLPISDGQVTWSIATSDFGAQVDYTLSGWFSSARANDKSIILLHIKTLMLAKFPTSGVWFMGRTLSESIYDRNRIDFSITAQGTGALQAGGLGSQINYFAQGLDTLTESPPESTGTSVFIYPDGGDVNDNGTGLIAPAPIAWDACNPRKTLLSYGKSLTQAAITLTSPGDITPNEGPWDAGANSQVSPFWLEYNETISYEIDNCISVFWPKTQGASPILQQTANPKMYVIQAGYGVKAGKTVADGPQLPLPFGAKADGTPATGWVVLKPFFQFDAPKIIGTGALNRYTCHWRYVSVRSGTPAESLDSISAQYPIDQMRTGLTAKDYVIPSGTVPESIFIPAGTLPDQI